MSKSLTVLFICIVLSFSGAGVLRAQQANTSKSAAAPKGGQKNSEAYTPSSAAKTQFMRETGYRNGRPGYVVVYRKPLACGGTESTDNLEWLTTAEAKAREKLNRKGCK